MSDVWQFHIPMRLSQGTKEQPPGGGANADKSRMQASTGTWQKS